MHVIRRLLLLAGAPLTLAATAATSATHTGNVVIVAMIRDDQGHTYFAPREIHAQPGDTLRFVEQAGTHDVFFLPDSNPGTIDLPPKTVLAEKPGETIDVVVNMKPGRYYFQCDPHVMRGMVGYLTIVPESTR